MESHFWGRGGRRGSAMVPHERAMVVSYRLSIVTVALSVTIRPQFAIECLRRSKKGGWLWAKISWCSPWSRFPMFGSAESEHHRLTDGEITLEERIPTYSNHHNPPTSQTDGRTDRQTTCDRNTALCTKVHRSVKILWSNSNLSAYIVFGHNAAVDCPIFVRELITVKCHKFQILKFKMVDDRFLKIVISPYISVN